MLRTARTAFVSGLMLSGLLHATAQTPAPRLAAVPAATAARFALPASPKERLENSQVIGHLSGETAVTGMKLYLKPTAAQQADLDQLVVDQQTPGSAAYHQWLTPAQYGARFGLADADLSTLTAWLQARGFTVDAVAPSRNFITFSGTASTVESAFAVSMQRYRRDGREFFENSTAPSIPAALADVVGGITGISSFRAVPHARHIAAPQAKLTGDYTTSTAAHYLVPWDVRQIFGVNTLISSGFDGTGVKIGVIGQSAVDTAQLTYFQQKTGQTVKLPTMILVPNTGVSNKVDGDEGESELDLEYSGGVAPGASIQFIYTGCTSTTSTGVLSGTTNCGSNGVFDALSYAVTNAVAPILTLSYGGCESSYTTFATAGTTPFESVLKQANVQGQTIMVSSGDTGATSCEGSTASLVATGGLSVSYPASSMYVTAVGGTALNTDSATFWSSTNNSFEGSVNATVPGTTGPMPAVAWNDTVAYGSLSASGGGASAIFNKPSWQTGTGVPADSHRDVPDVAFPAAVEQHAYIVCSQGSTCSNSNLGFGTSNGGGGLVGGTSAAAPVFAAMLAVVEQANGGASLGNINPSLYTLAAGSSASSIFQDITSGNNIVTCKGGTTGCSSTSATTNGTMGFSAGTGYDQVTGLGSILATGLQAAFSTIANPSTLLTPSVVVAAATSTPTGGTTDLLSITVAGSGATPTGTVTVIVDGTALSTATALSSGTANYTYAVPACTATSACSHTVLVYYAGNAVYKPGSGTLTLTVPTTSTGVTPSFTLKAASSTVTTSAGGSTTNVIAVTPAGGFTGAVTFSAALTSSTGTFAGCYLLPTATVASAAVSSTMTIYTATTGCASSSALKSSTLAKLDTKPTQPGLPGPRAGLVVFSAGLLACFTLRKRVRAGVLIAVALSALTVGMTGCSSSGSAATAATTTSAGTYVITVTGTSGTLSTTTSFTLTVQ
ncbi:Pro-kumamolisin, activation domain [Terriglobus roseus]|uniref:Pro-kumamolisin, activation domain n=2 Tax=Terriglobus roseus TaxID=392734 RepID=A0A1H4NDM0_9BACT|nr:Pro-kumamolisin, activation domain [Terriglobus roseus]